MPIYELNKTINFPHPSLANSDGLLAIGGDLRPMRLLEAYRCGIFPWYSDDDPILWWSPNPRMVLFPKDFIKHKSLKKVVKNNTFEISFDNNFEEVIEHCSSVQRIGQEGTWITDEMKHAYINLHNIGFAHSVEAKIDNQLVGGLYGVSIGKCFFGESMFHTVTDASKVAIWYLVNRLIEWEFDMIDVQQQTQHLNSLGAISIDRKEFLLLLFDSIDKIGVVGKWNL